MKWTECSEYCGEGIQSQTRNIINSSKNGGKKCPFSDKFKLNVSPRVVEVYDNSHIQGSSSVGAILLDNEFQLRSCMLTNGNRMYQEYIDGMEYTVDVLCDKQSNVLLSAPRKRLSTKSGQSVKGVTVNNYFLNEYVEKI